VSQPAASYQQPAPASHPDPSYPAYPEVSQPAPAAAWYGANGQVAAEQPGYHGGYQGGHQETAAYAQPAYPAISYDQHGYGQEPAYGRDGYQAYPGYGTGGGY
jgi:hypothetical protein